MVASLFHPLNPIEKEKSDEVTKRRSDCIIETRVFLHLQLHATQSSVPFDGKFPEQAAMAHQLLIVPKKSLDRNQRLSKTHIITLGLS
jgi:hypothetical protein